MLIQGIEPYPQIIADERLDIGIADHYHEPTIFRKDGKLYIRHFYLSTNYNTQNWRIEDLNEFLESGKHKPLIMAPGFHHIVGNTRDEWLKLQEPYAVASMEEFVYNNKYGCFDAISEVTSDSFAQALEDGYIPKFVSPAVRGTKVRIEMVDGKPIRIFEKGEVMHSAIVKNPAFRPVEMATINDTACKGGQYLCKMKLTAIAEDLESPDFGNILKNNFASLNNTFEKNIPDTNLTDDGKSSNHVDTLLKKMQEELNEANRKMELQQEKLSAVEKAQKDAENKLVSVEKERNDLKSKTETYEAEKAKIELKKALETKLKTVKIFVKDADLRAKKVDELADKNFKVEDLDIVYENQFLTEDQIKAELETVELPKANVGIAEESKISTGIQTQKTNVALVKGAMILDEILELRL